MESKHSIIQQHVRKLLIAIFFLGAISNAKAMNPTILQSTLEVLEAATLEIGIGAVTAGAYIASRTNNPMPEPEIEEVLNHSNGVIGTCTPNEYIIENLIHTGINTIEHGAREHRRGNCNLI